MKNIRCIISHLPEGGMREWGGDVGFTVFFFSLKENFFPLFLLFVKLQLCNSILIFTLM